MKNAYLIVTDLHYAENKANRKDYFSEILQILQNIAELSLKYRQKGYSPQLIFLGDVTDTSIANAEEAMRCVDVLRFFVSQFDRAYSVVGNHEETYIENNPFWFLVSEIGDKSLSRLPRALQPKSVYPCIAILDTLSDGEVTFYFNHYGIVPKVPEAEGVRIGLFHQNIGSNDICQMWGTFDNVEEAAYVQAYNYCFFGHMHMAYGKYELNEKGTCIAEWLGSCGRANILEVENAPLKVNVPAILVEDGIFNSIEDNYLTRPSAEECIDYDKANLMRTTAAQLKEMQDKIPTGTLSTSLLASVTEGINLAGLGPILTMLQGSYDSLWFQYQQGLQQVTEIVFDDGEEADITDG